MKVQGMNIRQKVTFVNGACRTTYSIDRVDSRVRPTSLSACAVGSFAELLGRE